MFSSCRNTSCCHIHGTYGYFVYEYDRKEQIELTAKLDVLQKKAMSVKETADKAQQFLGFIRKYTELEQLDAKILNELIDKIIVWHKTVNEAGEKVQKIGIHYKFVGLLQAG